MKKYKVIYSVNLQNDINKLVEFYNDFAGYEAASNFRTIIYKTIDSLSVNPELYRIFDYVEFGENIRRAIIPGKKARIIYRIDNGQMQVIAVLAYHTSQNPSLYRGILHSRLGNKL